MGSDQDSEPSSLPTVKNYFARLKVGGKPIRQSLETTGSSVTLLGLPDAIKKSRKIAEFRGRFSNAKLRFGDTVQICSEKLDV